MKFSSKTILQASIVLVILTFGCKTNQSPDPGSGGKINQVDRSGNRQGPWQIYQEDVLIAEGNYLDGQPDGLWKYWYQNGHDKAEGNYDRGIKNGMWVEWYPDGEVMWKGEWVEGKRQIGAPYSKAEIKFIGEDHPDHILARDSTYHMRIRIMNVPVSHVFVEVNSGSIARDTMADLYILRTSSDSTLKMAIGYMPDLEFKDFRNLVTELDFTMR